MQVFLSWSGLRSQLIAQTLRDWLPKVLQQVQPFLSSHDIDAGIRWSDEIASQLDGSSVGIICLTVDNQQRPWLNFEAGAIAKSIETARVIPLAIDLTVADIRQPLGQFFGRTLERSDMAAVVASLNNASANPLPATLVEASFEKWWPDIDQQVTTALAATSASDMPPRSDRDLLDEVLETVRSLSARAGTSAVYRQEDPGGWRFRDFVKGMGPAPPFVVPSMRKLEAWDADGYQVLLLTEREPLLDATRASLDASARANGFAVYWVSRDVP